MSIRHNFLPARSVLLLMCVVIGSSPSAYGEDAAPSADADVIQTAAAIHGTTREPGGTPLPSVKIVVHGGASGEDRTVISGGDGIFFVDNLKPGRYELTANREGAESSPATAV